MKNLFCYRARAIRADHKRIVGGDSVKYIQRRGNGYLETVDEFTTRKEARAMLVEYRISDPTAHFHISSRACKAYLAVNHDKHKK